MRFQVCFRFRGEVSGLGKGGGGPHTMVGAAVPWGGFIPWGGGGGGTREPATMYISVSDPKSLKPQALNIPEILNPYKAWPSALSPDVPP